VTAPPDDGQPLRLVIVDDHELVRTGFVATLAHDERFAVVAATGSAREGLAAARRLRPDVAVVDLRLPDMSGVELCRALRAELPGTPVIILSAYGSEDTVREAMDAGASAYLTKSADLDDLLDVLARMRDADRATAEPQIAEHLRELLASRATDHEVSARQMRVLDLAAQGLTYDQIAERLCISRSTVRFHIHKLRERFGARTRTELIVKAVHAGVIAPPAEDRHA
jgi:RNA polymerase sigma factor (sigma-70 family)